MEHKRGQPNFTMEEMNMLSVGMEKLAFMYIKGLLLVLLHPCLL